MATKIIGLDSLNNKLRALPAATARRIRKAMAEAADQIVATMRNIVPVDSGELQKSIDWTWGSAPAGAMTIAEVRGGGSYGTGNENTITIYAGDSDAYYARFVEFGTAAHTAGGMFAGTTIPAIPANPFFYVSYRANRTETKRKIARAVTAAAKAVAAGRTTDGFNKPSGRRRRRKK